MRTAAGLPAHWRRYIKSGSGRARGPNDDERSGIDFTIRTIGRHTVKKTASAAQAAAASDSDASASEEELGSLGSAGSVSYTTPMKVKNDVVDQELYADPLTMSAKQLKGIAGDVADDLACAYFQHTARVTAPAIFRPLSAMLSITNEKGESKLFRKGQVRPPTTPETSAAVGVLSPLSVSSRLRLPAARSIPACLCGPSRVPSALLASRLPAPMCS